MRIRKILCAIDFSVSSNAALKAAAELARHFLAELLVLHVIPFSVPLDEGYSQPTDTEQYIRSKTTRLLREACDSAVSGYGNIQLRLRIGDAETEILEAARTEQADLIVMGSHGTSGWRAVVFGSVTESVLRGSQGAALTIRPDIEQSVDGDSQRKTGSHRSFILPPKTILCPTDFSESSNEALRVATQWSREFGSELCVLHVLCPLEPALGVVPVKEFEKSRAKDAALAVHHFLKDKVADEVVTRVIIKFGDPAREIVEAAEELEAEVITISTHGETGWRHLVFRSVMEAVVRTARCPVLTVPSSQTATETATRISRSVCV